MNAPTFHLDPALGAALATSAGVALLLPVVLAAAWRRRTGAPWRALGWGALVFVIAQPVLRLPWQIPLARWAAAETGGKGAAFAGFLLLSALTAGLFEETGRWLGYRFLLRAGRGRRAGVMFGLGHGGIESILLVGTSLAGLLVAAVAASQGRLPEPALSAVTAQLAGLGPAAALAGGFERACALALHVGLSLVVLQAFTRPGGFRWVLLAMALHAAVNAAAVAMLPAGVWAAEGVVAAASAAVAALGWRLASPREEAPAPAVAAA